MHTSSSYTFPIQILYINTSVSGLSISLSVSVSLSLLLYLCASHLASFIILIAFNFGMCTLVKIFRLWWLDFNYLLIHYQIFSYKTYKHFFDLRNFDSVLFKFVSNQLKFHLSYKICFKMLKKTTDYSHYFLTRAASFHFSLLDFRIGGFIRIYSYIIIFFSIFFGVPLLLFSVNASAATLN